MRLLLCACLGTMRLCSGLWQFKKRSLCLIVSLCCQAARGFEASQGMGPSTKPRQEWPPETRLHSSRVQKYLEDTMEEIDPSFTFCPTSIHRKSMIRALLGCSKMELEAHLTTLEEAQKWHVTEKFIQDHLHELLALNVAADAEETFREGLVTYSTFKSRGSNKLFTYMARGRTYKGTFKLLLEDAAADKPEWMEFYQNQIQASMNETERLELLIDADLSLFHGRSNNRRFDDSKELKQYLDKCIHYTLGPPAYQQPADGGKSRGEASEYDLISYLTQVLVPKEYPGLGNGDEEDGTVQVVAPVMIQNRRKDRNPNYTKKARQPIIELPECVDLHGVTSELDALVLKVDETEHTIQILQVWEAKAALNPVSIGDALQKKTRVVQEIMDHSDDSIMILKDGRIFHLQPTAIQKPKIGIFGSTLATPKTACKRLQTTIGEFLLETDANVVQQVLDGEERIVIPSETVERRLSILLELASQWDPSLVLSSDDFLVDE